MKRQSKEVDFKQITLSVENFIDAEYFESMMESFGIERSENNDCDMIVLTVVKVELL